MEYFLNEMKHQVKSFSVDFLAGSVAGIAVTLVGHPFE